MDSSGLGSYLRAIRKLSMRLVLPFLGRAFVKRKYKTDFLMLTFREVANWIADLKFIHLE